VNEQGLIFVQFDCRSQIYGRSIEADQHDNCQGSEFPMGKEIKHGLGIFDYVFDCNVDIMLMESVHIYKYWQIAPTLQNYYA
jgi:hypothetical protein